MTTTTYTGDCRAVLATLPEQRVHLCITSPPYFGLRTYSDDPREIGREAHPEAYITHLVSVFAAVRRVLRDDGVLVLNLGDSFANDTKWGGSTSGKHVAGLHGASSIGRERKTTGLPPKSKLLIPHRVALALQADGWIVRQDPPWLKRAAMPENVNDRPTTAHEYVFLLAKSARYYWDGEAIRGAASPASIARISQKTFNQQSGGAKDYAHADGRTHRSMRKTLENFAANPGRNYRSTDAFFDSLDAAIADTRAYLAHLEGIKKHGGLLVDEAGDPVALIVNPKAYKAAHFAVFPPDLVDPFIRAGSPRQCCPTCGAGWVRQVEKNNPRNSEEYRAIQDTPKSVASGGLAGRGTKTTGLAKPGWREFPPEQRIDLGFAPACACPNNDGSGRAVVLDPFGGSGTTAQVAERLGRDSILIDLNPDYAPLQDGRLNGVQVEMPL